VISVSHLTKKYGRHVAVDDLTFDVEAGEVLGFLGPNGAGKTTTMRMVTGYLPPSKGRIRIDGFDLYDHPIEAKRRIGYLPENPPVYPEMTVRSYLGYVSELKDVPSAQRRAAVDRAIARARLTEVAGKRIGHLSKGFKQRVGLAQAIVHEPPVLILDEPTSSLDPKQRADVRDLIAELKGSHTVILSTHILPEVSEVADRVIIVNRGRIVAVDTPANLGGQLRAREVVKLECAMPAGGDGPREIRDAFAAMVAAGHLTIDAGPDQTWKICLESPVGTDLRAQAAALVVSKGWRLLGLAGEPLSLQEIFLQLTDEDAESRTTGPGGTGRNEDTGA
jgi:ABC-2 type transport system ATP-binding protein